MDLVWVLVSLLVVLSCCALMLILKTRRDQDYGAGGDVKRAPEAGGGWPLMGHLHLLAVNVPAHRILGDMADKYGPIFRIRLGRKPTLVVSSWEIAKECLGTNDKVFLERPDRAAVSHAYGGALFALGPRLGQYWKNMRRISTHELLSNQRLELFRNDRSSEVRICIKHLFSLCQAGHIDMSDWLSLVSMNVMTKMVVGKSFNPDENEWRQFVKSTEDFTNLAGTYVISDVIPFTEWMDLQGHFNAVKHAVKECDRFITGWLQEHVWTRKEGKANAYDRNFIDVMLMTLENDPSLSYPYSTDVAIKSTIWSLIIAGAESTTNIMNWTLSLLANHPEILKKVRDEIDGQTEKKRWVEESDMKNLAYLIAVLKETLRLKVPLNLLRESSEDCTIAGYHIPKGTTLIVNLWKLHHDPRVWPDPDEFQPERFLSNTSTHFNENDKFMFIPFSAGRRSCPGPTSAMQMISLVIGRVLQGFNLATPDGQKINMREGLGFTNPRATPLELVLTPRLPHDLY